MLSTVIRNGNGTAVIMIIFGIFFLILEDPLRKSQWNVFLNPFDPAYDVNETTWAIITLKNRIILITATILFPAHCTVQSAEKGEIHVRRKVLQSRSGFASPSSLCGSSLRPPLAAEVVVEAFIQGSWRSFIQTDVPF